jgi:transcriptional regulator with XRE-family HTH domain
VPRTASSQIASKVVGREIRETRAKLGLAQVEVAERLGVTGGYIASVEAGRHNLTLGQLMNIAAALGVGIDIKLMIPEDQPMDLVADGTADGDRLVPSVQARPHSVSSR